MNPAIPRRILMTADTVGGVWTYAMELCRAFQPYGIEVALATMGAPLALSQSEEVNALSNVKVFQGPYKLEWMDSPWFDVAAAGDWLLGLQKQVSPDLVHLNGYSHAALPWRVPKLVVGHSCVLSWWQAVKGDAAGQSWNTYGEVVRAGLQAADLVVAPSCAMLAALREHYGPLESVTVIPNGRDPQAQTRNEKQNLIFAAGRIWDEAKNLPLLESVAPSLSWPVCIAGDEMEPCNQNGDHRIPLSERAFQCKGTAHPDVESSLKPSNAQRDKPIGAHFLGRLGPDEMQQWFSRAAIYVSPAKYEPFGLSVLEAALAGCALVLGDIPSFREIWGDCAVYITPTDKEMLRRRLEDLIQDRDSRTDLARRARKRASEFSTERMTRNYLAAYSGLLRKVGKPETELEAACAS